MFLPEKNLVHVQVIMRKKFFCVNKEKVTKLPILMVVDEQTRASVKAITLQIRR